VKRPEGFHGLTLWAGLIRADGAEVDLGEAPAASDQLYGMANVAVIAGLLRKLAAPAAEGDQLIVRIYGAASVWADPIVRGEVAP
jgi:hypothetical protein